MAKTHKAIEGEIDKMEAEWSPRSQKFRNASPDEMGRLAAEAAEAAKQIEKLREKLPHGHPRKHGRRW
jgi:hypothetical protein